MVIVENKRLMPGQIFINKDILWMQIAKEQASCHCIKCFTKSRDHFNLYITGDQFHMQANFFEHHKWKDTVTDVHDGSEGCDSNIDYQTKTVVGNLIT